uniref:Translocator protein n=1 Tax=Gopherus agassizii TaxID=38772 RepID=A0A452GXX3_9SAUR
MASPGLVLDLLGPRAEAKAQTSPPGVKAQGHQLWVAGLGLQFQPSASSLGHPHAGLRLQSPVLGNWLCCLWKELGGFSEESVVPLGLYAGQLALNWAWTPIFFGAHKIGWGLVDLLLTSGAATATAVTWYHVNKKAGYLMFPCLAWLTLASVLNYRIWKDN